jgi:hypothetical protein
VNKAGLNEKLVLVAWLWIPSYDLEEQSMARSGYWLTPLTFIVSAVLVILALLVRYAHVSIAVVSAHVFEAL